MSVLLRESLSLLTVIGMLAISAAIVAFLVQRIYRIYQKNQKQKKYLAIRNYATRLNRLLRERYGIQEKYTPDQVKQTAREWGYSTSYDCYSLAMYCSDADFGDYHRSIDEPCSYDAMRHEISTCLSLDSASFTISDLTAFSAHLHSESHHHDHDYVGHDHGYDSHHDCDYDC